MKTTWFPIWVVAAMALTAGIEPAAAAKKKVIVVSTTTGYRHGSIPTGNRVLQDLANRSEVFEIVDWVQQPAIEVPKKPNEPKPPAPNAGEKARAEYEAALQKYRDELKAFDPEKAAELGKQFDVEMRKALAPLSPENLDRLGIDGVIFNNTTGDLPLPDAAGFIAWIERGHAFIAMHAGSDTLHKFPAYAEMLGGDFDGHPWAEHVTVKVEDAAHPAAGGYSGTFEIEDEIYQFKAWSRGDKHVIFSLDASNAERPRKAGPDGGPSLGFFERGKRADGDYALAWVREFGQGRVFYSAFGHRDDIWTNPEMQKHFLGGIEWALGAGKKAGR